MGRRAALVKSRCGRGLVSSPGAVPFSGLSMRRWGARRRSTTFFPLRLLLLGEAGMIMHCALHLPGSASCCIGCCCCYDGLFQTAGPRRGSRSETAVGAGRGGFCVRGGGEVVLVVAARRKWNASGISMADMCLLLTEYTRL